LSCSRPAPTSDRAALRRGLDEPEARRRLARHRRRRRGALRRAGRAARGARADLGDGGVSRAARRAPVVVAHDAGHRTGRRESGQRQKGRRDGTRSLGRAVSPRILIGRRAAQSGGASAAPGIHSGNSLSRKLAGVRAGRPSSVAKAPVTSAVTSNRWLSASRISWIQIERAPRISRTYVVISSVSPERAGARYFTARSAARIR